MRFMIIRMADGETEAGTAPDAELQSALDSYTEELVRSGVLLASEWLQPSAHGARLRSYAGELEIIPGPFTDDRELVAGFTLIQARSIEEAIERARRWPALDSGASVELEVRQVRDKI
jgi:hypothetical protein